MTGPTHQIVILPITRCGKGTTFEGGMRVPGLINFNRELKPGVFRGLFSHMDFMPLGGMTRVRER